MNSPPAASSAESDHSRWLTEEVLPHEPAMRAYLRSQFPAIDPDDVVQESYLKIWKARARGNIASAKSYLFMVVRNTALLLGRRARTRVEVPLSELPRLRIFNEGQDAADAANAQLRMELIRAALQQLPSRCRHVVALAVLRGRSNAEIASELGLSEATVRVHLHVGIKRCAAFLRERGERA